jgi:hypothetical protein
MRRLRAGSCREGAAIEALEASRAAFCKQSSLFFFKRIALPQSILRFCKERRHPTFVALYLLSQVDHDEANGPRLSYLIGAAGTGLRTLRSAKSAFGFTTSLPKRSWYTSGLWPTAVEMALKQARP